jgi:hypothetical protein
MIIIIRRKFNALNLTKYPRKILAAS